MKYPHPRMLVYIAMADAYALAVEYVDPKAFPDLFHQASLFQEYLSHPVLHQEPGIYSDDTEMSVANAQVLIEYQAPFTPLMFANAYVRQFRLGGQRKGYARHFQAFLEKTQSGQEFLNMINSHSDKNGAAMRSVPLGVLPSVKSVLNASAMQVLLTHATPAGIFSAQCVALMSHFALYEDASFSRLHEYLMAHLPEQEKWIQKMQEPWSGPVINRKDHGGEGVGINTVHAVYHLLVRGHSLMDIMKTLILFGGDTDSVAAIAWGIASVRMKQERLPSFLETYLEPGNPGVGKDYLQLIGTKLMAKYAFCTV
ncbi:MAG: ADP-ribosylation/Crystallin J1 [Candidatus Uhrbacteria bacterium GW2011_GWE2_40_58]|nr:MAG: ADP-ribosylation/Crystallin J1 [Candidatus Uhrbacteria bacterium GW2011_GWF2_40_263]KKR67830.1 MAG: ADP-ribosylation/Crystallin J1 [Candidatus Uhrbacteria bacterium GW2011_GWE2_40_58]OGL94534.1 MAG: hypothetical protein A2239_00610 [Candidatus Uhrbacteria bacterium RIFOXYA2_FULL_40_9]OGL96785.1 MAG: hypothetical protein A2332_04585 [Candidatus Uhrbacteria bacterium RIFOXYB2_FULL_41_18]HBK34502.1 hypothetical protein [Candidatus Uhrbacteria bacterium]